MGLRERAAVRSAGCLCVAHLLSSCAVADVDLLGKHCPCTTGYVCDPQTDTCVFPTTGDDAGGPLDAQSGDASGDSREQGDTGVADGTTKGDTGTPDGGAGDAGGIDATADVESDAATFACGPMRCLTTDWCQILNGLVSLDGGGVHSDYACNPLPGGCEPTPTCPCLGKQVAPCACMSFGEELTVTCGY